MTTIINNEAITLDKGETYVIELPSWSLSNSILEKIRLRYKAFGEALGVNFFILDPGFKIAKGTVEVIFEDD